jgi:hypothetical protein
LFISKSLVAPDSFRLIHKDGSSIGNKTHRKMGNGNLVFDSSKFVMSSMLGFRVTKPREITFNFSTQL